MRKCVNYIQISVSERSGVIRLREAQISFREVINRNGRPASRAGYNRTATLSRINLSQDQLLSLAVSSCYYARTYVVDIVIVLRPSLMGSVME